MRILAYLGFAVFLGGTAYAATDLSPNTEMAFTLKDVFTYCGMVAAVGASWAHAQSATKNAQRTADEADRKASATHERMDELVEMITGIRLEMREVKGQVVAFSDTRFNTMLQSIWSMHEALGKAGVVERRNEQR